jgi:hypothetical protein
VAGHVLKPRPDLGAEDRNAEQYDHGNGGHDHAVLDHVLTSGRRAGEQL